jgi:hypothetical protein
MALESFYIMMMSNSSRNIYPENNLNKFKNELPQEIYVGDFKVALQSISLDSKWGTIPNNILGTSDHFLIFPDNYFQEKKSPVASYSITDFVLTKETFVEKANKALKTTRNVLFRVVKNSVDIVLTKCTLLVHEHVNNFLHFGKNIVKYEGENYCVLKGESAAVVRAKKDFNTTRLVPRLIKVRLREMKQNLSTIGCVQELAILSTESSTYPFYSVCKRKEYFPLSNNKLSTLSIDLVDEDNYPIHLGKGQPSIVKLQLKRFAMDLAVLRLSSLESKHIFSDNKSSSFRIQLQQSLDAYNTGLEVALSSIYVPSQVQTKSMLSSNNFYIDVVNNASPDRDFMRFVLSSLTDFTNTGFVNLANDLIQSALPKRPVLFSIEEDDNVMVEFLEDDVSLRVTGLIAYLFGRSQAPDHFDHFAIKGEKKEKKLLTKINFKKLRPHVIFLHCNFTKPIIVGNQFGQVLQMIPYYNSDDDQVEIMKYEAQHLDFIPISMNDKTVLQFEMRTSGGLLVPFVKENAEVLVTLVFRQK